MNARLRPAKERSRAKCTSSDKGGRIMKQSPKRTARIADEHIIATQVLAAAYAKVNPRTVRRWVRAGMPRTEDGKYIRPMLDIYKENEGSKASEHKEQKIKAEVGYKQTKAELLQMELAEKKGELISADEEQKRDVRKIIAVKRALIGQGRKLAPTLAPITDDRKIKKIIDRENREIIAAFAASD